MHLNFPSPAPAARRSVAALIGVACVMAGVELRAADPAPADARIQFSDPEDGFQIPAHDVDDPLSPKQFESLNQNSSLSGVIGPSLATPARPTPNNAPTGRLLELYQRRLDEKKNWIYQRPGEKETDAQPTVEEIFGVRETTLTGTRGRSVLMEFFEAPARKASSSSRLGDSSRDLSDRSPLGNSWESESRSLNPRAGSGNQTDSPGSTRSESPPAWGNLNKPGFSVQNGFVVPDQIRPDDSLDPSFRVGRGRDGDQLSHSDEFRKLLVIQNGINPLAAGFDPINLRGDATRQDLNPVTSLDLGVSVTGGGIAGAAPVGAGPNGSLFESAASPVGSSSLAPAVPAPSAASRQLRQPTVLEMPRRKF